MIKVFTGVQFICSLLFTIALWVAPYFGWVRCNSDEMIRALSMADYMWLLTIILVLISLAKHEKDRIENEAEGSRNY